MGLDWLAPLSVWVKSIVFGTSYFIFNSTDRLTPIPFDPTPTKSMGCCTSCWCERSLHGQCGSHQTNGSWVDPECGHTAAGQGQPVANGMAVCTAAVPSNTPPSLAPLPAIHKEQSSVSFLNQSASPRKTDMKDMKLYPTFQNTDHLQQTVAE